MTLNTQSNPIIQITKILMRFIGPLDRSSLKTRFTAKFTSIWGSLPFSNPLMQSSIGATIPLPIPNFSSIFLSQKLALTFPTASNSKMFNTFNDVEGSSTHQTLNRNLSLAIFATTWNRAKNTPICPSFEGYSALFTGFYNHKLIIS